MAFSIDASQGSGDPHRPADPSRAPTELEPSSSVASTAEILVDLPTFPVGAEEPADAEEHDARDGDGDARAQHRPVEPDGAAVVGHVDDEPHHAQGDPDAQDRVEDPFAANVPSSFLQRIARDFRHHPSSFAHRLPPGAGRSAVACRGSAPSTWTSGSQVSQEGRYQLRSPRSFIVAGTRTERTMVASISSATAMPKPICWNAIVSPIAKPQKTAMMMSAAPVMRRAVEPMPKEIAAFVSPVWVYRSRMRLSRNTW